MKTKEFAVIGRKLLPNFPGFVAKGQMIFKLPVDDFLRGVFFENSSDPQSFYLRALFLPLFIPQDCISFIHGVRIGNALSWRGDNPNLVEDLRQTIEAKAIPILENVSTLAGVLDRLKAEVKGDWPRVNSHYLEELAYALIKNGEYSAALESLGDLKHRLVDSTIPWVIEQHNRAQLIEEKLLQRPEAALAQLEVWKEETIRKLGLEKYQLNH